MRRSGRSDQKERYEKTFDRLGNSPVSEDRSAPRCGATKPHLPARLQDTRLERIADILALVSEAAVQLFGDARRAT